jgi:pimeloyl-ACP methyl ester carboxylesterase
MFKLIAGHRFFTIDLGSGSRTFFAHNGRIGTYEDWLPTLEVMSKRWRVVSYDHRGAGETTVPIEEITATALVDDIFRVMDAMEINRCVLGGFSSGTGFTVRAALRNPSRFVGLVLMNGAAGVRPPNAAPAPPRRPPSAWPGETHTARMRWFIEQCTPEPNVEHIRRWGHQPSGARRETKAGQIWGNHAVAIGEPGNRRQTHMSQGEEPVHQQHGRGGQVSSDAHEDTNTVYRDDFVKSGHEKVPMCTEVDGAGQANGSMGRNYAPAHLTMGRTRGGGSDGAAPALSSQSRAGHALLRE